MAFMARAMAAGGAVRRALTGSSRVRGGGGGHAKGEWESIKEWWGPGDRDATGTLFNETPPPPGQRRKWEDWELPYYIGWTAAILVLVVGLNAKPDTRIDHWARKQAIIRMRKEGIVEQEFLDQMENKLKR